MPRSQPKVVVPRYHVRPAYGALQPSGGGSSMTVLLGPHAALSVNYGSPTSAHSIPALMTPLHVRDPGKWIAGHLLNDNLGGSGTDARNLTPLTQTANKQHAKLENRVKDICTMAELHHRMNPKEAFWIGVRYTVTVSAVTFGGFFPYDLAPSHITVKSRVVKVDKATSIAMSFAGVHKFSRGNFGPTEIHNDDAHLV